MITKIRLIGNQCVNPGEFYKYQRYYIQGIKKINEINFSIVPKFSKFFASLSANQIKGVNRLWYLCNSVSKKHKSIESNHVGRYIFYLDTDTVKVAIDVADGREIRDLQAYEWCDIYFKANKWDHLKYPEKVLPIVNGNGFLTKQKITQLKQYRNREKELDLIFMTVIYASSSSQHFYTNIEHHVRLFEVLAKLNCRKFLKAIIPRQYTTQMIGKYLDRLDRVGVPWSYSWDGMSTQDFWDHLAKAELVFLRPGKHGCISWRMIDLLGMGSCVIYDANPHPVWPVPLANDKNFVSCDCGLSLNEQLPSHDHYIKINQIIEALLNDRRKREAIRRNNRNYFDQYATPSGIAKYIFKTVKNYHINAQQSVEFATYRQAS
jgi:hypothetical protein